MAAMILYMIAVTLIVFCVVLRRKGLEASLITNITHSVVDMVSKEGRTSFSAVETLHEENLTRMQTVFLTCYPGKLLIEDSTSKFLRKISILSDCLR
jgi:hypothetical protein